MIDSDLGMDSFTAGVMLAGTAALALAAATIAAVFIVALLTRRK